MAVLNATNFENVVPQRQDLVGDAALFCHADYYQGLHLTLEGGGNFDMTEAGTGDGAFYLQLRETPDSADVISNGDVVLADSSLASGEILIHFPASELTSAWANREVTWSLSIKADGYTQIVPVLYGKALIRGFATNPSDLT